MASSVPGAPGNGGLGRRPDPARQNVMAVRTELVKEYLLDSIFDEVMERYPGDLPAPAARALEATLSAVLGPERAAVASRDATSLATGLGRAGYLTRIVETDMFERAREPSAEIAELLSGEWFERGGASWSEAVLGLSAELARAEPAEKAGPDDERSMSWTVAGPGGHVRHFLALRAVTVLSSAGPDGKPQAPEGLEGSGDTKRCWMYGFYRRCCEEALPPDSSLETGAEPS